CKSSKNTSKSSTNAKEVEVIFPCSGSEYKSTNGLVRATGMGESMDQQIAKRMARSSALEELTSKLGVTMKAVANDYYKSISVNLTEDLERRFEGNALQVINQYVSGYNIVCEKFMQKGNNYKCYLAIEIGEEEMLRSTFNTLTKDQILQVDYDYERFKKTFNDELKRFEQNR
ncbi:hypothetical protein LJB78_01030, partial [Bacteroidales bacterium OttesenSCG-928-J16]|nr:hypothetical protein [Bacteroidales bacterium OttesenSCG-928-J16]